MFPFGHLIGAWIVGLLIQNLTKKDLSRLGWGLLLVGGLLPDVDYAFDFILGTDIHRTFTHSLIFVILIFFVAYVLLKQYKLEKSAIFLSIGTLIHIILDLPFYPGTMLFWPLGTWFWFFGVANEVLVYSSASAVFSAKSVLVLADVAFGLVWLTYLYIRGKINF